MNQQDFLRRLEKNNDVELYKFAAETVPLAKIESTEDVQPIGKETRLGDALASVLQKANREPVAGVVVVSDGRLTGGRPLRQVYRSLRLRQPVTVHAVGVGRRQVPKNYAIRDLEGPRVVEVGYPLQIEALVSLTSIPGPATVSLTRSAENSPVTITVEERRVEPMGDQFEARLKFVDKLPRRSLYRYTVRIVSHELEDRASRLRYLYL